jgi:lipid II:glycine glycyltransferase (peptidoglycan interpeptide bridge formation enzyme)
MPKILDAFDDRPAWDAFVRASPHGHLFQTWAWGDLQDGLGGRPVRIAAAGAQGLSGCLQMLVFESTSRTFAYVPRGPVADPADTRIVGQLIDAARGQAAAAGCTLLRVEPQWAYDDAVARAFDARGFARARQFIMPRRTLLVDLPPALDDVWAGFRSNTRNRIRLATKLGVEVRIGRAEDMSVFVGLFEETVARHGLRRASTGTFDLAWRHFGARDEMRLFLARHDGVDLSGIVVFIGGPTATYLWGGSAGSESARRLNPNQLLHWTAMQWAHERGCRTYDLFGIPDHDAETLEAEYGRQTGGMWNLYRFKRGFGGSVHRHLGTFDCLLPGTGHASGSP